MSGDSVTEILVALAGIKADIHHLRQDMESSKIACVSVSRLSFTAKHVLALAVWLSVPNIISGAGTYYALTKVVTPQSQVEAHPGK